MVVYQGGKARIGKKIHDVLIEIEEQLNTTEYTLRYFEPFVGVASVMRHFGDDGNREMYGCDINKDVLMMLRSVQKNWNPPRQTSKKEYDTLKKSKKHSAKRGFIGLVGSWGGNFYNGYRLTCGKKQGYVREGANSLIKLRPSIKKVDFLKCSSYDSFDPDDMLIYCDPPYIGNTLGPDVFKQFDHDKFWQVMRSWSKNNIVIISEWAAPKDFRKIWGTTSHVSSSTRWKKVTKKYQDNLYIHKSIYDKISPAVKRRIKKIK
jgi:site-specific DNA-adenine methylase